MDFLENAQWFFESLEEDTLRNYRRGFTLFARMLAETGLSVKNIVDADTATAALMRVLRLCFEKQTKLSAVSLMKTSMCRVFKFIFNVDVSQTGVISMAMRFYTLKNPPVKEPLRLQWSIEQLLQYLKECDSFTELDFNSLTQNAIVLCMAFTVLRFKEMERVDLFNSEPDLNKGEWKVATRVKGHKCREYVWIFSSDQSKLDAIAALLELRRRTREKLGEVVPNVFWHKEVHGKLIPLSYNEIRGSAASVLKAAGIPERRAYRIKHAVLTYLSKNGASARELAAFARHKFGSMAAYEHYVSYDDGKGSVEKLAKSVGT
jgi:site-specific recombinase XerD